MQPRQRQEGEHIGYEPLEPSFSISHFVQVLRSYGGAILLSLLGIGVAFGIIATIWYLKAPSQRITSVPFRLEFKGAAEGKYPNGMKFSTNEILNTPVLIQVYAQNGLDEYVSFPAFSKSVFVVEQNREYERLEAEYQARLSDVRLTPVDRERIEKEFQSKRAALSKSDYAISYLVADRNVEIPQIVLRKVLGDILREWSSHAAKTQRALLYDVPVLSPRFVEVSGIEKDNHLAALQILRTKVTQVRANLNLISELPGAQLVRASDNSSLEELKLELDDLLRFQIEPQLTVVRASGLISNPALATQFLESQLAHDERRLEAAQRKAEAIREALVTYTRTSFAHAAPSQATAATGTQADSANVVLGDSFLDRVMQLTNSGADQEYRQKLTEDLRAAAVEMIPITEAVEFDRQLLEVVRKGTARTASTTPEQLHASIDGAKAQLRSIISRMNEIYLTVSRNLNPATALYTVTGPPSSQVARTVSMRRLVLYGGLTFLVSLPLILGACLLHNRIREEESEAAQFSGDYRSASQPIPEPRTAPATGPAET